MRQIRFTVILVLVLAAGLPASGQDARPGLPASREWSDLAAARALASDDASVRRSAITSVRAAGTAAVRALPALVAALDDDTESVRAEAAAAIAEISARSAFALADYADEHEKGTSKKLAPNRVLGTRDPFPGKVESEDPSPMLIGLFDLGPALSYLDVHNALAWDGAIWRRDVIACIGALPMHPWAGEPWALGEQYPAVTLAYAGDRAVAAVLTATLALQARESSRRRGRQVPVSVPPDAVVRWSRKLRSRSASTRLLAAGWLARWGPAGDAVTAATLEALAAAPVDESEAEVRTVLDALSAQGADRMKVTAALRVRAAKGCGISLRSVVGWCAPGELAVAARSVRPWEAAREIQARNPVPKEAIPILRGAIPMLRDSGLVAAARCLYRAAGAQPDLVREIEAGSSDALRDDMWALAACWLSGLPADRLGALEEVPAEEAGFMGAAAAPVADRIAIDVYPDHLEAIAAMGPVMKAEVPKLIEWARTLRTPDHKLPWDLRHPAIVALEKIGPAAAAAGPVLDELRKSPEPRTAYLAGRARRAITSR